MSSVCVIDPEHATSNVVEIMLSTQKLFGTTAADLAGTAVFIEGQQILARDLRRRIMALTKSEISVPLNDPEDITTTLCGEELYFAYGSNMVEEQMRDRCKSAVKVCVGVLNNHKIVFNRKGTYRPGGVASVEESEGQRVYGVIWKMHSSEFWDLDEKEDPKAYVRKKMSVSTLSGEHHSCHIYVAIPQRGVFKPGKDYLKLMVRGARETGLPDDYIRYLEEFKD
jgi:cation transport regulator ChaC